MEKRYLRLEVSDKFQGLGGPMYPIYIPVIVKESENPPFENIIHIDAKPSLLTEEEFN